MDGKGLQAVKNEYPSFLCYDTDIENEKKKNGRDIQTAR
jgi:hypothetical protein